MTISRGTMVVWFALLAPAALAEPRPGAGGPGSTAGGPTREAVERLLAGYEPRPIADELRRLGDGVDGVLVAIARDPKTNAIRRVRALYALGHVPSEIGRAECRAVIRDEREADAGMEVLDVAACAEVLGAFGAESQPELVALLDHASAEVRGGVARGLSRAGARAAVPALKRRLAVEKDAATRSALGRSLAELLR